MRKAISTSSWRPRIIAHRGGAVGFGLPENSLAAFIAARDAGFASECDVWGSADGWPVVIHDQTLDRTTTAGGDVAGYDSIQLRKISLRGSGSATVPMLSDVAQVVDLVEIKPANARLLVQRVIQIMAGKVWTFMSFDQSNLLHARAIDPAAQLVFLVDDLHGVNAAIAGQWTTHVDQALLEEGIMRRLRDAGLSVGAWTVDTREQLERMMRVQPDLIISNTPKLIRQWLGEAGFSA